MNQIYRYIGYSKQAFHQKMNRWLREHEQQLQLLPIIAELRQEHPGVAARELYPETLAEIDMKNYALNMDSS